MAEPPATSVTFLLVNLGRRAKVAVDERLHATGLAYHHFSALGHLRATPGLSYSELARRADVTVQSMQTTVAHLEQMGLVDRGTPGRGRRADLTVTAHGQELLAAGLAAVRAVDDELMAGIDSADRAALEATLLRTFLQAQRR